MDQFGSASHTRDLEIREYIKGLGFAVCGIPLGLDRPGACGMSHFNSNILI